MVPHFPALQLFSFIGEIQTPGPIPDLLNQNLEEDMTQESIFLSLFCSLFFFFSIENTLLSYIITGKR